MYYMQYALMDKVKKKTLQLSGLGKMGSSGEHLGRMKTLHYKCIHI